MAAERDQMLSHYRLVEKIGEGGMGVVWKAADTILNRTVAIKVLPADLALDEKRRRMFLDEARLAASVSHAHIVQVYELGREGDLDFIAMEYVEGQPLSKLLRGKPLPPDKVAALGLQVAEGLSRAHRKGLIHRDLKPANILVTPNDEVKIVDFGLAVLFEQPDSTATLAVSLSEPASEESRTRIAGTLPYMSPEQVRGEKLDARSDIFSFGSVLYEMSTGRRPFPGDNAAAIAQEILKCSPRPVQELMPQVPLDLNRIVQKSLAQRPHYRYQTMDDLAVDLRRLERDLESEAPTSHDAVLQADTSHKPRGWRWLWPAFGIMGLLIAVIALWHGRSREPPAESPRTRGSSAALVTDTKSIAVLPFVNMSEDKANEYFSDGISEELLNLLAKIPQLKVAARTSSFSFKGKEIVLPEIARQLHVAHVLEGSVRRSGNRVRITAQLVHAADGFHLWSQTYDRTLDDIFRIQDEIAADVVKALEVTLLGAAPKARTTDPKAYALYLQAVHAGRQMTAEAFEKSDALYRQVLAIDPRYAPAWVGLAWNSKAEGGGWGLIPTAQGNARAREAAEKALAIDPEFAPAYMVLGALALSDHDPAGAARLYERALVLAPTDSDLLGAAAQLLYALGRLDESLALREAILRRDPVSTVAHYVLGHTQRSAGRFEEAVASYRTALSLGPGIACAHADLGITLLLEGDAAGALAEIEQEPNEAWRMIGLPMAYHALGRKADSDVALAALAAKYEKDAAYNIASIYAFRGEADQAFSWLDKAVEYGDSGLQQIAVDKLSARIHSDPRWPAFLRRIDMAPEQLAKIEFHVTLPR